MPNSPDADPANAFDTQEGYSGQDYHVDREEAEAARDPSGQVNPGADRRPADNPEGADLPPENGRRAFVDPRTGEVHGSGAGAGGGSPGEDFDSDPQAGDGYPGTGAPGEERARERP